MTIRIVTDSTCDLPESLIKELGISVVPLYINADAHEYLDGVDISREEYYQRLPDFKKIPTTAVPSPQKFRVVYDSLVEQGATHIISIHISRALSAVIDVAKTAASEISSIAISVLDSQQLSMGTGFLVETAARMAKVGHSLNEIMTSLESQIKRTYVFAALDTLEYLKKSGRMNRFMSSIGSLLQIKPILIMHQGTPRNEKVRTREKTMARLIDILSNLGPIEKIGLLHTHAFDRIQDLRQLAKHLLPDGEILVEGITPVIGTHIGPGAYGFACVTRE